MFRKYNISISVIFLLVAPWLMGALFDWAVWVPVIYLALIYIPMSYWMAISTKNVLLGVLYSIGIFAILLIIFSIIALMMGVIGSILIIPSLPELAPIVMPDYMVFNPRGALREFLLWNFAGFNAVVFLVVGYEEKEVEKKEDSGPEKEE